LLMLPFMGIAQPGQLPIKRVDQMPDLPAPYLMRNWKAVAIAYDQFIFDRNKTGEHLPLLSLKAEGTNYPDIQPILLKTYVGAPGSNQAEAINIIPALVSASLMGIDKADQEGVNWVEKAKDFYNSKNNQNVYLNGYSATSGSDWWYDLMPNVFFYQLYSFYPNEPDFREQFLSVADRWLEAVYAMSGSATPWSVPQMHYRGWYLATMTPNTEGVKEPESAGTIAWLLYQAYRQSGQQKYLTGAQLALDFLAAQTSNPSYELQLPYGTLIAAKLNAELGANYPLDKMLNWSFDRGSLRGWGTIVGAWDGSDVSGLVGEANDGGDDYAFLMNGFQQAAALVPLVKYDKRYARALAKWTLNLANASRLFYPRYLHADKQDDWDWSAAHDPESVIGYEALKENWQGNALYGTGDAKRNEWAATNLALYGSSHAGYLAAIVEETNVEGILKLDLNATDFFTDQPYSSFLFFNPHPMAHTLRLQLGSGAWDLYDAISETDLAQGVSGTVEVQIPAGEVLLLTYVPAGTSRTVAQGRLFAGQQVLDYHYGWEFDPRFRLKAFAAEEDSVAVNTAITFYAEVENAPSEPVYTWYVGGGLIATTAEGQLQWTSPQEVGEYTILLQVTAGNQTISDSLTVSVLAFVPKPPVINALSADNPFYYGGEEARIICRLAADEAANYTYAWTVSAGSFVQEDSLLIWTTPAAEGIYNIGCRVTNNYGQSASASIHILVKEEGGAPADPLAYYPLNSNAEDYSGNSYHGSLRGVREAADARGMPDQAYRFSGADDVIWVANAPALNMRQALTLAFWLLPQASPHEAFILSHGSWEERWKVSLIPDGRLRWTVKTEAGVKDLDSRLPLAQDQFVHVTVVYSGYSMEVYLNGELDAFLEHSGAIMTTGKALTFGQKSLDEGQFYLNGVLDEVRIYAQALAPDQIRPLQTLWLDEVTGSPDPALASLQVYPNPSTAGEFWITYPFAFIQELYLINAAGQRLPLTAIPDAAGIRVQSGRLPAGLYFLKIVLQNESRIFRLVLY
jgi:hypothetical protein